jgi:RND superfamily putative drug exporter
VHIDAIFRAIGSFAVRFRWLVVAAWVVGAIAAVSLLPSLSSVTQNNNTKFLPASAPSSHAAELAAPFGTAALVPIPVVAARSGSPLAPADITALTALQGKLKSVAGVSRVLDAGRSPDGHAEQLVVLAQQGGGNQNYATDLVNGLRTKITQAGLPAGLQAHLAGDIAAQVDQQKASGNTGSQLQLVSLVFIIGLLVLIFRSLTLALTTVAPALFSVLISGPLVAEAAKHGLQVSPLAQFLLIVLVLGAGTDYGLFLVFRVREELRAEQHGEAGENYPGSRGLAGSLLGDLIHPRPPARNAIVRSVTKVGESITFSAATVIAAVLTLLFATFSFYSDLAIPFAIAIGVILIAGLTLLPALLSVRLSLLAVKRSLFRAIFGRPKLLPWNIQGSGKSGVWGRVAGRIVRHPAPTLIAGVAVFGGLSFAVFGYTAAGFGGNTAPPSGSDSAAGQTLLTKYFPQSSANPTTLIVRVSTPVCSPRRPASSGPAGSSRR